MGYSPWGHKESDATERLSNNNIFPFTGLEPRRVGWGWGRHAVVILPSGKDTTGKSQPREVDQSGREREKLSPES